MNIKLKVSLILSLFAFVVLLNFFILYISNNNISEANIQNDLARELIKKVFDLEIVNHDLLGIVSKRAYRQWNIIYSEVGYILDRADFDNEEQKLVLRSLRDNYLSIQQLLIYLKDSKSEELSERLRGQLNIRYQSVVSDAEKLSVYSSDNLKKALSNEVRSELVVASIYIISIIAVYLMFTRQISAPLKDLTESCEYMNENYSDQTINPKIIQSTDEIGQLANSFLSLIKSLRESIQETDTLNEELEQRVAERTENLNDALYKLASSEELFRRVFETSSNGMALADMNGIFTRVNKSLCEILGYEEESLVGMTVRDVSYEEDYQEDLSNLTKLKNGEVNSFQMEKRYLHKDGHIVWGHLSVALVQDSYNNPQFFVGQIVDITDRKLAQEKIMKYADTQKILLSEVNHRVKNNLTSIISMMHMEEVKAKKQRSGKYQALLKEFSNRIESLFTVHTMLSRNEWKPLYICDLAREILNSAISGMAHNQDIRINITNSKILISSNQAHQLTLIYNELATNTLKHAGLDTAIEINMRAYIEAGKIVIVYSDNGKGYPQEILEGKKEKFSVGFDMLNGIVNKSLGGDIEFYNHNGAVCCISIKEDVST